MKGGEKNDCYNIDYIYILINAICNNGQANANTGRLAN